MTGKVWIESADPLPVGKMSVVKLNVDGAFVPDGCRWEAPDQDGIQFVERSVTELIVCPEKAGTYLVGVGAANQKTAWSRITAGAAKRQWGLSWLRKLVPTGEALMHAPSLLLLVFAVVALVIVVSRPPDPSPDPKPPGPQPTPIVDSPLWIVVVEESAERTAEQAKLLTSKTLAERLKAKGHHFRIVDKDAKDSKGGSGDFGEYVERSKGKTLPVLFLVTPTGDVRFEGPLPANEAAFLATLGKAGG